MLVLVAPTLFAASIYMALGRVMVLLRADGHSPVRAQWLTKVFLASDVVSFMIQGTGAVVLARRAPTDMATGANIITVGLAVQMLFFSWFIVTAIVFHWRTNWQPTDRSRNPGVPWKRHLLVLYAASTMILVRCIYRFAEYRTQQSGSGGYLRAHEWCVYVFDAALMLAVMLSFFARHPSEMNALRKPRGGIAMRFLSGVPTGPVNDHWRGTLPTPVLSEKVGYEPGARVKRLSVHLPRERAYAS